MGKMFTISGRPGAGKTTIARLLAQRLGYKKFYSMGDLRGEMALERGLTIDQLNKIGESEDWTDKEVDDYQKKLGRKLDKAIFDGWLSFHFIPHSFKIFLEVDIEEAAQRIFKDQRPDEEHKDDVFAMAEMLEHRFVQSQQRYKKYYNIDILEKSHYDFIMDTTNISPDEVVNRIIKRAKKVGYL